MAYICHVCGHMHPIGVVNCKEARRIIQKDAKEFGLKVEQHRKICRGCPNPEQHVRNLDELDNPPKEPACYA